MGFPMGFRNIAIPRVLLYSASAMAIIQTALCWFLSVLGLSRPPQDESYLWQELPEIPSTSGEVIKYRLPILTFRNVAEKVIENEEDDVCAVCLSSFEEDDEIRELCNCSHIFHRNCLDKWIDNDHDTCPSCRCPLLPPPQSVDRDELF